MDDVVAQEEGPWHKNFCAICGATGENGSTTQPVDFSLLLPSLQEIVHQHECARAALPRQSRAPQMQKRL